MDKRLLVICGSVNPITLSQLDEAEQNGFLRLRPKGGDLHHRVHGEDLYALHLLRRSAAAGGQAPRQQQ